MTVNNQWLKKPEIQTNEMIRMYEEGLSSSQIAKKFGIAKSSVSRRLKKVGIKLRNSSDYDEEKRYWLWKGENYIDPITRKRNQLKHRKWSKSVKDRDNNQCQGCGDKHKRLHAHHIISLKECINTYLEFDVENGVTFCPQCHKDIHKGKSI